MSHQTKERRADDVSRRAKKPDSMYAYCRIIGCHQPATAGTESGLNRLYCRKHEDHYERHGSYTKPSYRLEDIREHRRTATKWVKEHKSDPALVYAIGEINRLYRQAGPKTEAFRLRGLKPEERAWAAWARLRDAGVDPVRPLIAWITIALTIKHDSQPESKKEYQRVQAAKLVHRMASGSHKRWERQQPNGKVVVEELHQYPKSRGLVLRHLGKQLEKAAGGLEELVLRHLSSVVEPA